MSYPQNNHRRSDQVVDNPAGRQLADRPYAICDDADDLAKQSFKDECDINNIMSRYQRDGVIDHVSKHQPSYGFISAATFTENMLTVANAKNMFSELPSAARKRFHNDPVEFLQYLDDNPNAQELYDLGLSTKKPDPPIRDTDREDPPKSDEPVNQPDD